MKIQRCKKCTTMNSILQVKIIQAFQMIDINCKMKISLRSLILFPETNNNPSMCQIAKLSTCAINIKHHENKDLGNKFMAVKSFNT